MVGGAGKSEGKPLSGAHILIVDDSHLIRRIQRQTLQEEGARVEDADNGKTALAKLHQMLEAKDPIELALVDLTMPVMDGLTLIREIRSDQQLKKLPIIVVSNEDEYETILECARHGISGFVSKECGRERLVEIAGDAIAPAPDHPRAPGLTPDEVMGLLEQLTMAIQQEIDRGAYDIETPELSPAFTAAVEYVKKHCPEAFGNG